MMPILQLSVAVVMAAASPDAVNAATKYDNSKRRRRSVASHANFVVFRGGGMKPPRPRERRRLSLGISSLGIRRLRIKGRAWPLRHLRRRPTLAPMNSVRHQPELRQVRPMVAARGRAAQKYPGFIPGKSKE